jgi:hypothetical protein
MARHLNLIEAFRGQKGCFHIQCKYSMTVPDFRNVKNVRPRLPE